MRADVVAPRGQGTHRGRQHDASFGRADLDVFLDPLPCPGVDDRPDDGVRVLGRADAQGAGRLDQPAQEGVVDPLQHDHPRARRALLPGVAEGALQDADDRLVEVGIVVDDDRVLAPHLGDHPLDVVLPRRRLGGPAIDRQPDLARAGEGDQVDPGIFHQRLPDVAEAGQDGQAPRRVDLPRGALRRACRAIIGARSLGFRTTVLPVTSAATVMPVGIASGKFQGEITTATPARSARFALVSPGTSRCQPAARRIISRA